MIIEKEINFGKLQQEIALVYPNIEGVSAIGNDYTFHGLNGDEDLTDVIDNHNPIDLAIPRIIALQIDKRKDFRAIDFNNELTVSLDLEEVFGALISNRGLLLQKKYKYNNIDILVIDYEYQFNSINEIQEQKAVLKWYNEDGGINDLTKDKGWSKLSSKDRTTATIKRREAVIGQLKDTIKTMMAQNATTVEQLNASIDYGNQLISHVSIEIDSFIKSGKTNALITKLDNSVTSFPFLLNELAPNFTVIDYINNFLNY